MQLPRGLTAAQVRSHDDPILRRLLVLALVPPPAQHAHEDLQQGGPDPEKRLLVDVDAHGGLPVEERKYMMAHMPTIGMRKTTMRNTVPLSSARLTPLSDASLSMGGSLELADPASAWQLARSVRGDRVSLGREDFLARVPLDLDAWISEAALVVGRHVGRGSVGVVLSGGLYTLAAAIPDPATLGPVYGRFIAPEQSLQAVAALPVSAGLWARYRFSGGAALYLQGAYDRTAARGALPPIPALPAGNRHRHRVAFGIELTPVAN